MLNTNFLFFLASGVLFQSIFLLKESLFNKKVIREVLITVGIALVGFFPLKNEKGYNIQIHILAYIFIFCLSFAISLREYILQVVNERVVLIYSIVFVFFTYTNINGVSYIPVVISIIFFLFTLYHNFRDISFGQKTKLFFYVIFLTITLFITGSQVVGLVLPGSAIFKNITTYSPVEAFFLGMLMLYTLISLSNLLYLVPVPSKHQKLKDRWKQVVEHANVLKSKFSDEQSSKVLTILLIIVIPTILVLDLHFRVIDNYLLINIILATAPFIEILHNKMNKKNEKY